MKCSSVGIEIPVRRSSRVARLFAASLAIVSLPLAVLAQTVGISTAAGQAGVPGKTDATGTAAQFSNPAGLAADGTTVYVADSANNRIRKLTISTGVVAIFGGTGVFSAPSGVAVDGSGNAFVADTGNHAIRKITSGGVVSVQAGLSGTSGAAVAGPVTMVNARFFNPQGIAVNSAGTFIYVADSTNNSVRRIDVVGDAVTTIASGFRPVGLALNAAGTILYVTDPDGHTIRSITNLGTTNNLATVAGTLNTQGSTDSPALFKNPNGISVDSAGDLYVADTGNNTVRKIVVAGPTVTTIAGLANTVGTTDGLGTNARFNGPFGIVATAVNSFYISDGNNHTIRRALPTAAPAITSANNATFTLNAAGTFTVVATGSPAPTFSITAGSLPSGVTLNLTTGVLAGTATVGGAFPVTIQASNGVGAAATQAFTLTVNQAPLFTSPNTATFSLGVGSTFTLTASGTPAPAFGLVSGSFPPWASLNTVSGAISGTPPNTTGSPFVFVVSATNTAGSVTQSLTLTVGASSPAAITAHPVSTAVNVGLNASFTGAASGNPTPTLQWQRQAFNTVGFVNLTEVSPYSGTTTGTLTVTGVTAPMSGDQFQLVASNIGATVTSTAATLSINSALPAFVTHPASTTVAVGNNGSFTAVASGNPVPTLRWQRLAVGAFVFSDLNDDATYSGTTSNTLTITTPTVGMSGDQFRCVATNANAPAGIPSNAAALTVTANAPTITLQPLPVIATVGGSATFTANGTGAPTPTFRWQRQPSGTTGFVDLSDDGTYAGTLTTTLTIPVVSAGMNGDLIRMQAINAGGSTPTNAVLLSLNLGTTITTFAGQATVSGAVDATGLAARFSSPAAIVVDTSGNFFIADTGNSVIRKMTPGGVVTTHAGLAGVRGAIDGPSASARFNSPSGVAVDGVGNVYVSDTFNHTIRVISPGGNVTTLAGSAGSSGSTDGTGDAARFSLPGGIAVDTGGNVYVADTSNHLIRRISSGGAVTTLAGGAGISGLLDGLGTNARFNTPNAVALDNASNIYVADSLNNAIRKVTALGAVTTLAGSAVGSPGGADGNGTAASFFRPSGIALDSSNNVFVSETINNTVRRITPAGDVTTVAGLATTFGTTDGIGSAVRFNRPFGLVVDANGNTYIADTGNHTIRRSGSTSAPQITTQPANRAAGITQSTTFTVVATGSPSPSGYQWQRQAANTSGFVNLGTSLIYTGVTTPTLTVSSISLAMAGDQFRVVVSNGVTPVAISDAATLSIGTPPAFTSAAAATFRAGEANTFAVTTDITATFSAPGLPVWLILNPTTGVLSGNPPDTTGSPLAITITASNGVSAVQAFTLTILPPNVPPSILVQPASAAADPGQGATFSVTAGGSLPFSYQWRRDGIAITGATNSTFSLAGVQGAAAGTYSVAVTNPAGTVVSAGATLTINTLPIITAQPRSQTALAGGGATFSVSATGGSGFSYQWRRNGVPIPGALLAIVTLSNVTAAEVGNYDVVVTNNVGSTGSSIALLTLAAAPSAPLITAQPAARTALLGGTVTLSVGATGAPSPTLQWRKNGTNIPGANGTTLSFAVVQAGDAANYDVVATNTAGTVTSLPAGLTVIARSYAGVYFGSFGGGLGTFALHVRDDNTAVFLGYLPGSTAPVMSLNVLVGATGQFTFSQTAIAGAGASEGEPARAAALAAVTVTGSIANNGDLAGSISGGVSTTLLGTIAPATGATQNVSGFYQAGAATNAATAYAIAGPNSQAFVVILGGGTASDGGLGTVNPAGQINVPTSRSTIAFAITAGSGAIVGSAVGAVSASGLSGGSDAALSRQRLLNISSRARVGAAEAVAIAGFVISGTESKPVLIRAVGPTLGAAPFGLAGALASPRLELFQGSTSLGINAGIAGNRAAIDAAGTAAGAFALGAAGTDAAMLTTLAPGAYTAVVSSATNAAGVALVEVYDLSAPTPGQKLLNISTRASAGVGENLLIAGFVVPAGTSKRVLVRGVGPGLAAFGVTGVLAQPVLTLFNGAATVASNTNWNTSLDSVAISTGSAQVGAFGLANNDSAMVVTLAPGNYTAQVTGVAGGTGIALIEVYELP